MITQGFVALGTLLVFGGAILTSSLVTAKAVLHQNVLIKTQTAMTDATTKFTIATKNLVQVYGTDSRAWPSTSAKSKALCEDEAGAEAVNCRFVATESWMLTGSSANAAAESTLSPAADAANLAEAVQEQRISVTISVVLSDHTGAHVYAERSKEVTARVFAAKPFVVITASREISAQGGGFRASEGDTAGAFDSADRLTSPSMPEATIPAAFTDTRILASIDCKNSFALATAPIGNAYFDITLHPYGNVSWHNESLCMSAHSHMVGMPPGYVPPSGSLYVAQPADSDAFWTKGDEDLNDFPR